MKVKLKEDHLNIKKGTEFIVDNQDDGFYTGHAFYQGWVIDKKGRKLYLGFDKELCKVVEW